MPGTTGGELISLAILLGGKLGTHHSDGHAQHLDAAYAIEHNRRIDPGPRPQTNFNNDGTLDIVTAIAVLL
jgi:hypothetical protein